MSNRLQERHPSNPTPEPGAAVWALGWIWYYRLILRFFAAILAVPALAVGIWLTLKRSCDLGLAFPSWFVNWYNRSGELRNLPAYFLLGLLVFSSFPYRYRRLVLVFLFLLGAGLEVCQLWIPTRVFDLWDIALSWAGALIAMVVHHHLRHRCRRVLGLG